VNVLADHGAVDQNDVYFLNILIEFGRRRNDKKILNLAIVEIIKLEGVIRERSI
jgi:hypothetical protein